MPLASNSFAGRNRLSGDEGRIFAISYENHNLMHAKIQRIINSVLRTAEEVQLKKKKGHWQKEDLKISSNKNVWRTTKLDGENSFHLSAEMRYSYLSSWHRQISHRRMVWLAIWAVQFFIFDQGNGVGGAWGDSEKVSTADNNAMNENFWKTLTQMM